MDGGLRQPGQQEGKDEAALSGAGPSHDLLDMAWSGEASHSASEAGTSQPLSLQGAERPRLQADPGWGAGLLQPGRSVGQGPGPRAGIWPQLTSALDPHVPPGVEGAGARAAGSAACVALTPKDTASTVRRQRPGRGPSAAGAVCCCVASDKSLNLSEPLPHRGTATTELDNVCGTFLAPGEELPEVLSLC